MRKFFTLALLFLGAGTVHAQVTSVVTAKISSVADLKVGSSTVAPSTDFEFTTAEELASGITKASAFTMDAKANKGFYISVHADDTHFASATAPGSLPVSALEVRIDNGTWVSLTNSAQAIIGSSVSRVSKGSYSYAVSYKLTPGLEVDPAQDYTTTISYTLSAP